MTSDTLLEETHIHMKEISDLFDVRLEDENTYVSLVEEARRELIQISDRFLQELLAQQKRIETLTEEIMWDGLTTLYNYKSFHCFLDKEYYRAKRYRLPLTLVIGDADDFKRINDTFGHQAGDEALRLISRTLRSSLRNSDIVARHGGEEFGILLTETPVADSLGVVERCRKMIESLPLNYEGRNIKVTMSFGISFFPPDSPLSQEEWMKQADRALYEAKHHGRNRICVYGSAEKGNRRS